MNTQIYRSEFEKFYSFYARLHAYGVSLIVLLKYHEEKEDYFKCEVINQVINEVKGGNNGKYRTF